MKNDTVDGQDKASAHTRKQFYAMPGLKEQFRP